MRFFTSRPATSIALFSTLAALALWYPAFVRPFATGFGDWQFFHHMWEAGYVALTRHAEWPLWDPYHCGGITIFGNPQSQHLSPFYLLALLAGPTLGSKLFVLLHAAAGFAGMYVLARSHGLAVAGACLATLAWAASGFFVSHGAGGHSAFLPFYLAPWVLLAWRAAATDVRHAVSVAALMWLVLLEGGVYPFPYLVLLLAFDVLVRLLRRENVRGILIAGVVAGALTAIGGAIRLLPIIDELRRNPRNMPSRDGVSLPEVLDMLTLRTHHWRYPGHQFVWSEYVMYVGWAVLAFAFVGLLLELRNKRVHLFAGLLLFLTLLMGDHGEWSVWSLVHRLPIYDSLRVPSRFSVFFTLYLGLLAGIGLDALRARFANTLGQARTSYAVAATFLLVAIIAVDFAIVHYPTLNRWKHKPIITDQVSDHHYLSTQSYGEFYASFPRMNLGSRACYEAMSFSPAKGLWSGDKPQARVARNTGALLKMSRTTRRIFIDVEMYKPGRLLVNQNYAPGWASDVGQVVEDHGKLALELPAGKHSLLMLYTPPTLVPSIVISACGLLLALVWWRFGARLAARLGVPARTDQSGVVSR